MNKEQEPPMESDEEMEDNCSDFIIDEALTEEEDMLMSKLQKTATSMLFDKVMKLLQNLLDQDPEGRVQESQTVCTRLSDGELSTAKSVKEIGADNLMAMMKDAEMMADQRQGMANGGEMMRRKCCC